MNNRDDLERRHADTKPALDSDEGADVMETEEDAEETQRTDPPVRRDDDIISLDPSD